MDSISPFVMLLVVLLQFADGHKDADAYIVPGDPGVCIEIGKHLTEQFNATGGHAVSMCLRAPDPFPAATPMPETPTPAEPVKPIPGKDEA